LKQKTTNTHNSVFFRAVFSLRAAKRTREKEQIRHLHFFGRVADVFSLAFLKSFLELNTLSPYAFHEKPPTTNKHTNNQRPKTLTPQLFAGAFCGQFRRRFSLWRALHSLIHAPVYGTPNAQSSNCFLLSAFFCWHSLVLCAAAPTAQTHRVLAVTFCRPCLFASSCGGGHFLSAVPVRVIVWNRRHCVVAVTFCQPCRSLSVGRACSRHRVVAVFASLCSGCPFLSPCLCGLVLPRTLIGGYGQGFYRSDMIVCSPLGLRTIIGECVRLVRVREREKRERERERESGYAWPL
jgi:hypothetical protein